MAPILNLNRSGEEIVLEYANITNSAEVALADVTFQSPLDITGEVPVSGETEVNTRVTIDARPESEFYRGSQTVDYLRLDIGKLFGDQVVLVTGGIEDHISALSRVNDEYQLAISETDVFPVEVDADGYVTVRISQHLIYAPNSQIKVLDEFDFSLNVFNDLIHIGLAQAALPAI